jgi:hypothetical protein
MIQITPEHVQRLVQIESDVHYNEAPPPGEEPFVLVRRDSPVLLSAPHGARTFRFSDEEVWHEEDEYTAALALLLSELCGTSVIATIWRTDDSDPNYRYEAQSPYKQELRELVGEQKVHWLLDLHGAKEARMKACQKVDLGTRKELQSLPSEQLDRLAQLFQARLGQETVSHNLFAAQTKDRSITAFSHGTLGIHSVQIEMKPSVRVPFRRTDASRFAQDGPYAAAQESVLAAMQALVDFIEYLHHLGDG